MGYHYEEKTPMIIENSPRSFRIWMVGILTIGHDVFWPIVVSLLRCYTLRAKPKSLMGNALTRLVMGTHETEHGLACTH